MTISNSKLPLSNANHACYKKEFESLLKEGQFDKANQVALEKIWWPDSIHCHRKVLDVYIDRILPPSLKDKNLTQLMVKWNNIDEVIEKAKLTQEQLKEIEAATLAPENLTFNRVWIWCFLSKCYEHAGNSAEAKRLEQKAEERIQWLYQINQGEESKEIITKNWNSSKNLFCFLVALATFAAHIQCYPLRPTNIFHLSMITGAAATYVASPTVALRGENLLGMYLAMTAVKMGMGPLPALGLGLTTSLVSRIPAVPNAASKVCTFTAQKTLQAGKAALRGMEKAAVAMHDEMKKAGAAMDRAIDAFDNRMNFVASKVEAVLDRTAVLMGKAASKLGSIGLAVLSVPGKAIGKLDQLMDRVAGIN
jgi:hypothetical protein